MGFDFKSSAKANAGSFIMKEHPNKIMPEDVITAYPDGITITGFDFINTTRVEKETGEAITDYFPVLSFKEDDKSYFNGGAALKQICTEWANAFHGDTQAASDELNTSGGVKIKMTKTRTQNNNTFFQVDVLD